MPSFNVNVFAAILCFAIAPSAGAVETGQLPPSCALQTLRGGKPLDLAQYKGKVVYLDFWASSCGPCVQSMEFLDGLQKQFKTQGLEVVSVNLDENKQDAEDFLLDHPVKFTLAADADSQCPRLFGVKDMPASYVIDRRGVIRHVQRGFHAGEEEDIRAIVQALLAEK